MPLYCGLGIALGMDEMDGMDGMDQPALRPRKPPADSGAVEVASTSRSAQVRARTLRREGLRLLVVAGTTRPSESDRSIRGDGTLVLRSKVDLGGVVWPADFSADLELVLVDPVESPRADV